MFLVFEELLQVAPIPHHIHKSLRERQRNWADGDESASFIPDGDIGGHRCGVLAMKDFLKPIPDSTSQAAQEKRRLEGEVEQKGELSR